VNGLTNSAPETIACGRFHMGSITARIKSRRFPALSKIPIHGPVVG
jgi:hypothetical protein